MSIEALIATWGLPALFLGGVVEGDGAGLLGGVLSHRGAFSPLAAWATLAAGAALADQGLFFLARARRDWPLLARLTATPPARKILARADRRPALASLSFRFLIGTRTLGPLALGLSTIPARIYVPCNLIAVAFWAALLTALGHGAGHLIQRLFGRLDPGAHLVLILGLVAAALLAVALLRPLRHRRRREG